MAQGESRTRESRNGTSRPGEPSPGAAPAPPGSVTAPAHRRDAAEAGLEVTGQFLAFETGLYAVDVVSARSVATDVGLRLPCVRIEPLPASAGAGQAFVSGAAEGGWLAGGATAFVLVVGGRTRVMLTVYKAAGGMAPPELRVRPLGAAMGLAGPETSKAPGPDAPEPPRRTAIVAPVVPAAATLPVQMASVPPAQVGHSTPMAGAGRSGVVLMAHVQGVGDVPADAQGWAGRSGSRSPVEGFSVAVDGVDASEIEYQAILGDQWNTPWTRGGGFCGSRGMALPILGFRVRLVGAAAERLECRYWGAFVSRGEVGPLGNGAACKAGQAFLEALRIVVTPRGSEDALPEASPAAAESVRAKATRGRR